MDMADQLITMVGEEVTTYLHGPFEYRTVVLSGSELSGTLIYKGVETNLKIISDDTLGVQLEPTPKIDPDDQEQFEEVILAVLAEFDLIPQAFDDAENFEHDH